mgnify:CR=1 FL=1
MHNIKKILIAKNKEHLQKLIRDEFNLNNHNHIKIIVFNNFF